MSNDYVHMIGQLEMNHVVNVVAINKFIQTKEGEEWNVQQMVVQYDSECKTKTWLDCKTELEAGYKIVTKLKCRVSVCVRVCVCVCVCVKHSDRITGRRNISDQRWKTRWDQWLTHTYLQMYNTK